MSNQRVFFASASAIMAMVVSGTADANTLVSTIDGAYDNTAVGPYDTPSLAISNSTAYDFVDAQLTLTPYQPGTDTYGLAPQSRSLGTISANSVFNAVWLDGYGGTVQGDLFSYDYDDSYGQTTTNAGCTQPYALCSYVGNFSVTFTATWMNPAYGASGTEISSVFSPEHNATGGFIGWEGLNPQGLSETSYDDHVGTPNGVLADIYVGPPMSGTPEPSTWAMLILGFAGVGAAARGRGKRAVAA